MFNRTSVPTAFSPQKRPTTRTSPDPSPLASKSGSEGEPTLLAATNVFDSATTATSNNEAPRDKNMGNWNEGRASMPCATGYSVKIMFLPLAPSNTKCTHVHVVPEAKIEAIEVTWDFTCNLAQVFLIGAPGARSPPSEKVTVTFTY